jgi:hypothetical protein
MHKIKIEDEHFFFRNIHYDTTICFEPWFLENVISFDHAGFSGYEFTASNTQLPRNENEIFPSEKSIYCIVDTESSGNFGHFFWESLINLRQMKRLVEKFPNIIFLVKNDAEFKRKIFQHYKFKYAEKIEHQNNYVAFFPPITSLINNKYTYHYSTLVDQFHSDINQQNPGFFEKNIEIVYFPRHQTIGNYDYGEQDRSFNTDEIRSFLATRPNCLTFDSEASDSWTKEIEVIRRARYIICHDGSAYTVLGSYAYNSTLIVLSNNIWIPSMRRFEKVILIDKKISSKNQRYFVRAPENNFKLGSILPLLNGQIVSP